MERPDINLRDTDLEGYTIQLEQWADYIESQRPIATEQLKEPIMEILDKFLVNTHQGKNIYEHTKETTGKLLLLIQPKAEIKFPSNEQFQSLMKRHGNFGVKTNEKIYKEFEYQFKHLNNIK